MIELISPEMSIVLYHSATETLHFYDINKCKPGYSLWVKSTNGRAFIKLKGSVEFITASRDWTTIKIF